MSWLSLSLIDKKGNKKYFGDYGLYLGQPDGGLPNINLTPSSETVLEQVARRDGAYFFNKRLEPRRLVYQLFFQEKTEHELNQIKSLFYCKEPHQLISDYHPYKYIYVVSGDSEVNVDYIWDGWRYSGFVSVEYTAYDPKFYSVFTSGSLLGYLEDFPDYPILYYDSGLPYIEDVPIVSFTVTEDGSVNIPNGGNYEADMNIKLVGSATNLIITNTTNDKSFTISSMSLETLYVDGIRGQVRNDTELKTNLFNGDFIKLESGDNIITITADSMNLTEVSFEYRYTYI